MIRLLSDERKLHESTDHVTTPGEPHERTDVKPAAPLKRKIGTISAAGPTYKGIIINLICKIDPIVLWPWYV